MNSQFHFNVAELQKELYLLQTILAAKENTQSLNTPSHDDTFNETATKSLILIAVFLRKLNEQTDADTNEKKRQQKEEILRIFNNSKCGTILMTNKEGKDEKQIISFLSLCHKVIHAYTYHYASSITMTGENPNNSKEEKWEVTFDINQFAEITLLILKKIQAYDANS